MIFLHFISNILVGALVGYLSLTQSLADTVTKIIQPHEEQRAAQNIDSTEALEKVVSTGKSKNISDILLNHTAFQRAAVIASEREEQEDVGAPDTPIDTLIQNALVNIYCQYKTDTYIRTTTGTGFFINAKGIILTNAHVAQFLLLEDGQGTVEDITCTIRTGTPATAQYEAELLYISPTWITENATVITEESPQGTGERDYALLYISKSLGNDPLPAYFPSIPFNTDLVSRGAEGKNIVTGGYPAAPLLRSGADAKLYAVIASSTVTSLYTFGSNYADLMAIGESAVGEHGASGGPIVLNDTKNVVGLIVTKGEEATEGARSLRAITLSYIDRTIQEETGFSLAQNMQGDVAYRGNIFKQVMVPFLSGILEDSLNSAE
jgi:hypothetical protein